MDDIVRTALEAIALSVDGVLVRGIWTATSEWHAQLSEFAPMEGRRPVRPLSYDLSDPDVSVAAWRCILERIDKGVVLLKSDGDVQPTAKAEPASYDASDRLVASEQLVLDVLLIDGVTAPLLKPVHLYLLTAMARSGPKGVMQKDLMDCVKRVITTPAEGKATDGSDLAKAVFHHCKFLRLRRLAVVKSSLSNVWRLQRYRDVALDTPKRRLLKKFRESADKDGCVWQTELDWKELNFISPKSLAQCLRNWEDAKFLNVETAKKRVRYKLADGAKIDDSADDDEDEDHDAPSVREEDAVCYVADKCLLAQVHDLIDSATTIGIGQPDIIARMGIKTKLVEKVVTLLKRDYGVRGEWTFRNGRRINALFTKHNWTKKLEQGDSARVGESRGALSPGHVPDENAASVVNEQRPPQQQPHPIDQHAPPQPPQPQQQHHEQRQPPYQQAPEPSQPQPAPPRLPNSRKPRESTDVAKRRSDFVGAYVAAHRIVIFSVLLVKVIENEKSCGGVASIDRKTLKGILEDLRLPIVKRLSHGRTSVYFVRSALATDEEVDEFCENHAYTSTGPQIGGKKSVIRERGTISPTALKEAPAAPTHEVGQKEAHGRFVRAKVVHLFLLDRWRSGIPTFRKPFTLMSAWDNMPFGTFLQAFGPSSLVTVLPDASTLLRDVGPDLRQTLAQAAKRKFHEALLTLVCLNFVKLFQEKKFELIVPPTVTINDTIAVFSERSPLAPAVKTPDGSIAVKSDGKKAKTAMELYDQNQKREPGKIYRVLAIDGISHKHFNLEDEFGAYAFWACLQRVACQLHKTDTDFRQYMLGSAANWLERGLSNLEELVEAWRAFSKAQRRTLMDLVGVRDHFDRFRVKYSLHLSRAVHVGVNAPYYTKLAKRLREARETDTIASNKRKATGSADANRSNKRPRGESSQEGEQIRRKKKKSTHTYPSESAIPQRLSLATNIWTSYMDAILLAARAVLSESTPEKQLNLARDVLTAGGVTWVNVGLIEARMAEIDRDLRADALALSFATAAQALLRENMTEIEMVFTVARNSRVDESTLPPPDAALAVQNTSLFGQKAPAWQSLKQDKWMAMEETRLAIWSRMVLCERTADQNELDSALLKIHNYAEADGRESSLACGINLLQTAGIARLQKSGDTRALLGKKPYTLTNSYTLTKRSTDGLRPRVPGDVLRQISSTEQIVVDSKMNGGAVARSLELMAAGQGRLAVQLEGAMTGRGVPIVTCSWAAAHAPSVMMDSNWDAVSAEDAQTVKRLVDDAPEGCTLAEIVALSGLSPSLVARTLDALVKEGCVFIVGISVPLYVNEQGATQWRLTVQGKAGPVVVPWLWPDGRTNDVAYRQLMNFVTDIVIANPGIPEGRVVDHLKLHISPRCTVQLLRDLVAEKTLVARFTQIAAVSEFSLFSEVEDALPSTESHGAIEACYYANAGALSIIARDTPKPQAMEI